MMYKNRPIQIPMSEFAEDVTVLFTFNMDRYSKEIYIIDYEVKADNAEDDVYVSEWIDNNQAEVEEIIYKDVVGDNYEYSRIL
jgi:hypothetical protein